MSVPIRHYHIVNEGFEGVEITIACPVGSADEDEDSQGAAHLMEHVLARQIAAAIHKVIGSEEVYIGARSYAFHTEFTFRIITGNLRLYVLAAQAIASVMYDHTQVTSAEVQREVVLIGHETDLRIQASPTSILPWSFAPAYFKHGMANNNSFIVQYPDVAHSVKMTNDWIRRLTGLPLSLGVISGVREQDTVTLIIAIFENYLLTMNRINHYQLRGYVSDPVVPIRDITCSEDFIHHMDALDSPVSLDIYRDCFARETINDVNKTTAEISLSAVVSTVLNTTSVDERVSAGLFGPWYGPDSRLIIRLRVGTASSRAIDTLVTPDLVEHSKLKIENTINSLNSTLMNCSQILARCVLFGWENPQKILQQTQSLRFESVRDAIESINERETITHHFYGIERSH